MVCFFDARAIAGVRRQYAAPLALLRPRGTAAAARNHTWARLSAIRRANVPRKPKNTSEAPVCKLYQNCYNHRAAIRC